MSRFWEFSDDEMSVDDGASSSGFRSEAPDSPSRTKEKNGAAKHGPLSPADSAYMSTNTTPVTKLPELFLKIDDEIIHAALANDKEHFSQIISEFNFNFNMLINYEGNDYLLIDLLLYLYYDGCLDYEFMVDSYADVCFRVLCNRVYDDTDICLSALQSMKERDDSLLDAYVANVIFDIATLDIDGFQYVLSMLGKDFVFGQNHNDCDLMQFATNSSNNELVQVLLKNGWDVCKKYPESGNGNILHNSFGIGRYDLIDLICQNNADVVLQKDDRGVDPCRYAADLCKLSSYYDLLNRMEMVNDGGYFDIFDYYGLFDYCVNLSKKNNGIDDQRHIVFQNSNGNFSEFNDNFSPTFFIGRFLNSIDCVTDEDFDLLARCLNEKINFNVKDEEGKSLLENLIEDAWAKNGGELLRNENFVNFLFLLFARSDNEIKFKVMEKYSQSFSFDNVVFNIRDAISWGCAKGLILNKDQFEDLFLFTNICYDKEFNDASNAFSGLDNSSDQLLRDLWYSEGMFVAENKIANHHMQAQKYVQFAAITLLASAETSLCFDDRNGIFECLKGENRNGFEKMVKNALFAFIDNENREDIEYRSRSLSNFYSYLSKDPQLLDFSLNVIKKLSDRGFVVNGDWDFDKVITILSNGYDHSNESLLSSAMRKSEIEKVADKFCEEFPGAKSCLARMVDFYSLLNEEVPELVTKLTHRYRDESRPDSAHSLVSHARVADWLMSGSQRSGEGASASLP